MVKLQDYLKPDLVINNKSAQSKKKVFEIISEKFAETLPEHKQKHIFEALITRERLGVTGLGHGIAIPHCRLENLNQPQVLVLKLDKPIDYDASDNVPVDIIIALVIPEASNEEHLQLLASIAKIFSNHKNLEHVRHAKDEATLYNVLINAYAP
ncbi:MAG: PTS IIA-like nitrogen-regulatory protein PtsN [Legionellales bacterium]|nr:PTS IIA-like nitrogen-regulatory protein PtsN [Legionellales bacterium]|tara:strand:+ start:1133 stop:1594 length:462 start_codon:yes stop_codon:yes gene_type:complete